MAIRKTRYQTFKDKVVGRDSNGNDIVGSVPDKVVTEPPVGVRFSVLEAPEAKVPEKEPFAGVEPATHDLTIDEDAVRSDGTG